MDSKAQPPANSPPPKPWERAGGSSGPVPFKPPSAGTTSDVVEASGTAKPGEIVSTSDINTALNRNMLARPVPTRPWEQNYGNTSYGGYGSTMNTGYGSGLYGSSYGGVGGMYGNSMARGSYGGHFGSGMYGGGGMYNSGLGGPMSGYGMGMGGPYGDQDPNNPYGQPSSPPGFWISVLRVMQGVVNFFGRISILVDQNTQALHMFMTALLQVVSLLREGQIANNAYRSCASEVEALVAQFQRALEEKDKVIEKREKFLGVQEAKIIDLSNDLIDRAQKLKATSTFL